MGQGSGHLEYPDRYNDMREKKHKYDWAKQSVCTHDNYKVYTDPIGVTNELWPLRCPQRKFGIFFNPPNQTHALENYRCFDLVRLHHWYC